MTLALSIGLRIGHYGINAPAAVADAYAVAGDSPELVADFPADYFRKAGVSTTFSGLFTYVGASSKYYRDSSGYVQEKTTGNARLHHHQWSGAAWVDEGILIENKTRTNLLAYSDDLANAIYTKTNITATMDQTGADNVTNSATRLTADAANGTCIATGITSGSAKHVYSALVKRITGTGTIEITLDNGTTWEDVTSEIITGEYLQVATAVQTIADPDVGFRIVTSGDEIAVQFSQPEVGSVASSPIPTSGGTAIRTAETLTIAGADTPFNTTAMSFHIKGQVSFVDEGESVHLAPFYWALDSNNRISVYLDTNAGGSGEWRYLMRKSGVAAVVDEGANTFPDGINRGYNLASRFVASSEVNGARDGTALSAVSHSVAIPAISGSDCAIGAGVGKEHIGTIDTFRMWGKDIADSGMESASTP